MEEENITTKNITKTISKKTLGQKILLVLLYSTILLMFIFSFASSSNSGKQGFDKCIDWKCEKGGEAYCTKAREVSNCCTGSGGEVGINGSQYVCVFR